MIPSSPECRRVLASLKDFQRRTVDHVFTKMYLDDPPAHRFLVADEVGLGKTMVARGLVARVLDQLAGKVERADVVYVCSNAAIAQQNLNRLTPAGQKCISFATRLTLLPTQLKRIRENPVNFVSFTPGTTFDLKSRGGIAEERALIYRMLSGNLSLHDRGLVRALQGTCSRSGWDWWLKQWSAHIDDDLAGGFLDKVAADACLRADVMRVCDELADGRRRVSPDTRELAWDVIGRLRQTLAHVCVGSLEPDLVILDEFQRFRHLLEGESDAALLARTLMTYTSGTGLEARVLLLSATPYRMFTLAAEANDDHYRDLLRTFRFLCCDDGRAEKLEKDFARFREALWGLAGNDTTEIQRVRKSIRRTLFGVMVRTERGPNSDSRNAMLEDITILEPVETDDLRDARELQRIATASGAGDTTEYWKSAPYLLNFMRDYELPVKLRRTKSPECELPLKKLAGRALTAEALESYLPVEPRNARLRLLTRDTLDAGHWRALWVSPSLPYTEPQDPYANSAPATKILLFSSWNVVPDAISMLCSYEAERRMLEGADVPGYGELTKKKKALLRYSIEADGRPTGMTALVLEYPSPTLSRIVDPLKVALDLGQGSPVSVDSLLEHARAAVRNELRRAGITQRVTEGPIDQRWYWAAPALLDCRLVTGYHDWLDKRGPWDGSSLDQTSDDESESGFQQHVESLREVVRDPKQLGRVPEDLVDTLALLSVASPACCALRSLMRVAGAGYRGFMSTEAGAELMSSAAAIARGFRTLFNLPETIALLRGGETSVPYWRMVLVHNRQGNLQALLDEYFHILRELLGLIDRPVGEVATGISAAALSALSLRPSTLRFSEIPPSLADDWPSFSVRCRYAMRFADIRDDQGNAIVRATAVRDAFNSPFRPFILSSTSIGQEGLDFHPYCHKVYHWNLPSNPVDMEQREGRVSRYKGHAVRKNLASALGLGQLIESGIGSEDPWETLFRVAKRQRPAGANDLIPYWIYEIENGARVERHVPILECSREIARYERLKKALAIYRLVFGQPRQQDLLGLLQDQNLPKELVDSLCISLAP